ncbi:hypothetical protein KY284_022665 [Solanum tuberosum]|nr:hypothetical protein KY284_022665 [Solanum tuberosum]
MKCVIKKIPTHALIFGATYNIDFLKEIKASIWDDGIELFKNTTFGPYLNFSKCNFRDKSLSFSIKDFAIITSLKCKGNVKDLTYLESTPSWLLQRYFPDATTSLIRSCLIQRFLMGNWENTHDAVQMAIMFQLYSWGQIAFTKLMKSFILDFNLDKQMYRLSSMSYALNEGRGCKAKIWNVYVERFLRDEVAALDLPDIQDAPPPGPSTTIVNPKEVQSKDISGFEDFSTSPPEQLVRSSSRVSGTSSPPPPKRRKKINTPKIKVSEPSQSEQLNVSLNQSFSMPDEPRTPTANVVMFSISLMKDMADKFLSCMVDVFDQKGNVEPQTTGLPWHIVDDVYIPVNCNGRFHWVLGVVELKRRDCGLYVAIFAEFLSDQLVISPDGFRSDYLRNRYATLLWRYDNDKADDGYVSENDDPQKPKGQFTSPPEEDLVHIE